MIVVMAPQDVIFSSVFVRGEYNNFKKKLQGNKERKFLLFFLHKQNPCRVNVQQYKAKFVMRLWRGNKEKLFAFYVL